MAYGKEAQASVNRAEEAGIVQFVASRVYKESRVSRKRRAWQFSSHHHPLFRVLFTFLRLTAHSVAAAAVSDMETTLVNWN